MCQKRDLRDERSGIPLLSELQSHWCQKMDSIGVRCGIQMGVRNAISLMSEVGSYYCQNWDPIDFRIDIPFAPEVVMFGVRSKILFVSELGSH